MLKRRTKGMVLTGIAATTVLLSGCVAYADPTSPAPVVTDSGTTPTVFLATFFEVPEGTAPVGIPAEGPADCKAPTD